MTNFSQDEGIADNLNDAIGEMAAIKRFFIGATYFSCLSAHLASATGLK